MVSKPSCSVCSMTLQLLGHERAFAGSPDCIVGRVARLDNHALQFVPQFACECRHGCESLLPVSILRISPVRSGVFF